MLTVEARIDRVNEKFSQGFPSKAAVKDALGDLSWAYDSLKDTLGEACLAVKNDDLYWALPMFLHHWRHSERFLNALPETEPTVRLVEQLVDLRNAVKNAPVTPKGTPKTTREAEVTRAVRSLMETRKASYERGLKLAEIFGGLHVTANVHLVTNHFGTQFLRAFYYLNGELTAVNVIIAIAEKLEAQNP